MIIAGFALFEAVLAFFQFPGTGVAFGMAIMPALILWYLSTAEVKAAFGMDEPVRPVCGCARRGAPARRGARGVSQRRPRPRRLLRGRSRRRSRRRRRHPPPTSPSSPIT